MQNFWRIGVDGAVGPATWSSARAWLQVQYSDGYGSTHFVPFASHHTDFIDGFPQFRQSYTGQWAWLLNGEDHYTSPNFTYIPSNHPGKTFGMYCS
jgi:hypothetical protein